ncbi:MAG TPA: hypothetical protein GXX53_06580 [Tissierellia bacterium]|nr:hypothetical protein [Tissierellia bacterium]
MKNPRSLKEIIDQTKKIDENNFDSAQCLNSINMLLASNDLGSTKDEELSKKFQELNSKIEDVNRLTSSLLEELSKRNN